MATATAVKGGVDTAMGVAKFFQGRAMQKKAEKYIENFEWQDLENPYENQQVSTLGAEHLTEQANIGSATAVEALRSGGARGLANIGKIEAARNDTNRQVATNLDEQQSRINQNISQQASANQIIMEKRQADELAGYGQMMNVGMGISNQGLSNISNGVGAIGQGIAGAVRPEAVQNAEQFGTSTLKPLGQTPSGMAAIGSVKLPWN